MPMYYYTCTRCGFVVRKIREPAQAGDLPLCPNDELPCPRTPRPASSQVVETLDNGLMPRRLERLADAERLFKERYDITNKKILGED